MIVNDFRFMRRVMAAGDIGFAEGFMAGEWDTPDLTALLESAGLNFDRLHELVERQPVDAGGQLPGPPAATATRAAARKRNIHAHYDLGNAFYERWLDPSMTYSSAWFERAGPDAGARPSATSTPSLARGIGLGPDHHVLEIGCGWGGFAEFAAARGRRQGDRHHHFAANSTTSPESACSSRAWRSKPTSG